jgi:tetratricopeptide (TPR) repeat protein
MKRKLLSALILGAALTTFNSFSQEQDFSYALKKYNDLQLLSARRTLNALVASDGTDCKSIYYIGQTYFLQNKYDSAEYYFKKIKEANPESPYVSLADFKIALRAENALAIPDILKSVKKYGKKDAKFYILALNVCLENPKPDTTLAKTLIPEIEKIAPEDPDLFISKAKLELISKDYGQAASNFEWAYYYDEQNTYAYTNLGLLYSNSMFYREAMEAFRKSVEIDPDQVMVYRYLGDLQYRFGKYPEAKAAYQKYLSIAEVQPENIEKYALILFYNKEFLAAEEQMKKVILANPSSPVMNRIMAYTACENGNYADGLKYINKLFELLDTSRIIPPDYIYYGKLLIKTGNDSLGVVNIKKALQLDDTKTEAFNDLAGELSKRKKHDDAIAIYEKLLTKGFDKPATFFKIGKEYYYKGSEAREQYDTLKVRLAAVPGAVVPATDSIIAMESYAMADSFFLQLTQINPDYVGAYLWRGRVLSLMDSDMKLGVAKDPYEKALSILVKDTVQNAVTIIECYRYLGAYYYYESEDFASTDKAQADTYRKMAIDFFQKIVRMDPTDTKSKEILDQLLNPPAANPKEGRKRST